MSVKSKISRAKAKLLVEYPLFGTIASKLELVQNDDIQAFKSDGVKLEYNEDFFNTVELSQIEFALANGAMHASLAHERRKNNRSAWLWQMATDFAINDMLVENGLDCPYEANYRKRFSGMYAEEIYAELKDDILRDELEYEADDADDVQKNQNDDNKPTDKEKQDQQDEEVSQEEIESEIQQAQQLFAEFGKSIIETEIKNGDVPKSIERFFEINYDGKIDWRDELRLAIDRFHKDDYTLLPPSKKFLHLGMYLPSSISERFKLVIAVDSSGSVDDELLNKFISEINFLMTTVQNYEIHLLVCDDKIRSHDVLYSGDNIEVNLIGGGGTDFRPVFELVEDQLQDTKLLLYFSDLDGVFPRDFPSYDVRWVTSNNDEVPFGNLIMLDSNS